MNSKNYPSDTLLGKLGKLSQKYEKITKIQCVKDMRRVKSVQKHRENYLDKMQKLAEARLRAEKEADNMRNTILNKIAKKEENAKKLKSEILERHMNTFVEQRNKEFEVEKNLSFIKEKREEEKKKLMKKAEDNDQRINIIKAQKKRLEALKFHVDEEIRKNKIIKVNNPYEIFEELNTISKKSKKKKHLNMTKTLFH